jgi:hypothetical protein
MVRCLCVDQDSLGNLCGWCELEGFETLSGRFLGRMLFCFGGGGGGDYFWGAGEEDAWAEEVSADNRKVAALTEELNVVDISNRGKV